MAHMASTSKMPKQNRQFYMQAGGYVLLRYVDEGSCYTVMTATSGEDLPHDPPRERRARPSIFKRPEGTDLIPEPLAIKSPGPMDIEAYPNLVKLTAAAQKILYTLGTPEERIDKWGRPYLMIEGVSDTGAIRRAANSLAKSLGLETVKESTADEEMQKIWDEFSVDESSTSDHDVELGDEAWVMRSGRVKS
ncbi:hypothetical protein SAMN04490248_11585 [Salinihabitans flavidus]|uniref:Uncharacterized protein n=2 Tax=Salinihabitans flavidus TaxID=569882 RepID=A0A1H8TG76_9RHOB|nr:hypothetical protein SAMN04490248_11585 [Salinihabitans flavidus]